MEVGYEENVSFKYIGVSIRQGGERVMMSQKHYSRGIKEFERWYFKGKRRLSEGEQSIYRFLLGKLNWLGQHTRPDLAVGITMVTRKLEVVSAGDMRRLIKLAEKAKNSMVEVNMGRQERENI